MHSLADKKGTARIPGNEPWTGYAALMRYSQLSVIITLLLGAAIAKIPGVRPYLLAAGGLQLIAIALMIGARKAMARHVTHLIELSERDPATGCLNRRGFGRALDDLAARGSDVAMLALDLDYFKRINDRYGHTVGDRVLLEVARALIDTTGDSGVVARLGGEEFGILLGDADAEDAGVLAERLVTRLRALEPGVLRNGERVTMSVGLATERIDGGRSCAALLARADEALYIAKRGGRNRAMLWAPGVRSFTTPVVSIPIQHEGVVGEDGVGITGRHDLPPQRARTNEHNPTAT